MRDIKHKYFGNKVYLLLAVLCLFTMTYASLSTKKAHATNPAIISFQGKVVNADGTNVTNGSYNFDFVLYDDLTLGTPSDGVHDKWHELTKSVTVTNGVFQTNLGSATALPDFNANPSLYLAVRFNADAAGYMSPRVQMGSVPYALNADKVGGVAASSLVQLGATQSGNINIGSGTLTSGLINGQTINTSANFTGTLTVQGASVTVGTSSQAGSLILFDNDTGSETVTLLGGAIGASYSLTLPTAAGATSQCLQTDSVTASQLIFASCSAAAGDSITVNGSAATDGNFLNTVASASVAGTTFALNTASNPDDITLTISDASTTVAGIVTANAQSFGGDKTFTGKLISKNASNSTSAFQVQNLSGTVVLGVDTTNLRVGIGTTAPANTLAASPLQYTSGANTASQSGNAVTGSGTTFTAAMIGSQLVYANGTTATITSFTSATAVTATPSQTVSSQTFNVYYPGLETTSTGDVGIGTLTPGAKLEVVGDIISKGTAWAAQTGSNASQWLAITYGRGMFVAVAQTSGASTDIMTSPDGVTWTNRTASHDDTWFGITYGNGLFVAVAASSGTNAIMTSPDGITWTDRTAPSIDNWHSVAYGNGVFAAVSDTGGGAVMYSTDGITWAAGTSSVTSSFYSVVFGNGQFVAVAVSGTNRVMTSPDGITWTAQSASAVSSWDSVTYGNGLYVAVASTGTISTQIMTSANGTSWVSRTAPFANTWDSVTYGNGLFVAVSANGNFNRVMTSPDGITWTPRASTANVTWEAVTYGNGVFVAVALSSTSVMTSGKPDLSVVQVPENNFRNGLLITGSTSGQDATFSGNINLGSVGSSTAASTIHIADTSNATGTQLVTIGSTAKTADIVTIQGGGAASTIVLQTAASGGIDIGVNNVAGKTINIGSVGTTAATTTLHVGDSSGAAQTITLGSVSTTSTTTIQGGSGNINLSPSAGNDVVYSQGAGSNLQLTASAATTADQLAITNASGATTTTAIDGAQIDFQTAGTTASADNAGLRINVTSNNSGTTTTLAGLKIGDLSSAEANSTETGVYIGTGWDVGLDVQSGGLNLAAYTVGGNPGDPPAAATDNLRVYAKKIAGRMMLKTKGPSGVDNPLQTALFGNNIILFTPTSGTTVTGGFGTLWVTSSGPQAATTPVPSTTAPALASQMHRYQKLNNVTTTNQAMGIRANSTDAFQFWRGNAAGIGGFFFTTRFVVAAWPAATVRVFAGLSASATEVAISNTVVNDTAGLWHDTTDSSTTFNLVTRNTATTTKTAITVTNAIATGNAYDFYMFAKPNDSTIFYRLDDLVNGTTFEGSTGTTLPTNTAFMAPQVEVSNGTANTTANTTGIGINRIYVESDY